MHFKHLFTYLLTALPHQKENGMFLKIYCITGPISYFVGSQTLMRIRNPGELVKNSFSPRPRCSNLLALEQGPGICNLNIFPSAFDTGTLEITL